jgi:uncharacterized protein (TIGR00725 family)
MKRKVLTVFGSSQVRDGATEYARARKLGRLAAAAGFVVCNGGYGGIMAASARGAKEGGGRTIGITTRQFSGRANPWIDREMRMRTWRERLFRLIDTGDAYAIFTGGMGTLVELACLSESIRRSLIPGKPAAVLGSMWKQMFRLLARESGIGRDLPLNFVRSPEDALALFRRAL